METLIEFIQRHGDQRAAEMIGVKQRTILAYRLGQRVPSVRTALKIHDRTGLPLQVIRPDVWRPVDAA